MASAVRYTTATNGTGAVLASYVIEKAQDYRLHVVKRIFAAIDIGQEAGKTRDATDPTKGCLVAQFKGALIKDVVSFTLFKPTNATNQVFQRVAVDGGANTFSYQWRVANDLVNGLSSIYVFDAGDNGATRIAENDYITALLVLGNS